MRFSDWTCPECGKDRGGTPEQVAALERMARVGGAKASPQAEVESGDFGSVVVDAADERRAPITTGMSNPATASANVSAPYTRDAT